MTVRQNLGYGLKVRRTKKEEIRKRVDEVAEAMLGLEALLEEAGAASASAAAGRHGTRDRERAKGVPHGRAAVQPRREARVT